MEGTQGEHGGGGGTPMLPPTPKKRVWVRPQSLPQAARPRGENTRQCAGTRAQATRRGPLSSHSSTSGTPACG